MKTMKHFFTARRIIAIALLCALLTFSLGTTRCPGSKPDETPEQQKQRFLGYARDVAMAVDQLQPLVAQLNPAAGKIVAKSMAGRLIGYKFSMSPESGDKIARADPCASQAKAGNVFLVAEVLIENSGSAKAPYNPLYFTVKDGDGFEYNAALVAGDNSLKSGELAQGEKARGVVAFEVKQAATGLVLSYKPLVFGASDAIRVALK